VRGEERKYKDFLPPGKPDHNENARRRAAFGHAGTQSVRYHAGLVHTHGPSNTVAGGLNL